MNTTVQVEVKRTGNETTANLVRRFQKRVQQSGILKRARSLRYASRKQSFLAKKKIALKKIDFRKDLEEKRKSGKMEQPKTGFGARR